MAGHPGCLLRSGKLGASYSVVGDYQGNEQQRNIARVCPSPSSTLSAAVSRRISVMNKEAYAPFNSVHGWKGGPASHLSLAEPTLISCSVPRNPGRIFWMICAGGRGNGDMDVPGSRKKAALPVRPPTTHRPARGSRAKEAVFRNASCVLPVHQKRNRAGSFRSRQPGLQLSPRFFEGYS
jgi:hypothetical protein